VSEPAPRSVNPATGELLREHAFVDATVADRILARASAAQRDWAARPVQARAEALRALAAGLRAEAEALAQATTLEMGKPLIEARAEVAKSASALEHAAEHGPAMLADERSAAAPGSYISYLPYGVLLAIMPWNFPVWQVLRLAASNLMCGNAVVLKHAPNVQGCAALLSEVLQAAGAPEGVFENLIVDTRTAAGVIADPRIAGVAFTGSVRGGRAVAAAAGAAGKKTLLELGGSDPFIVLEDADIAAAAAAALAGRFANCGQVCIAPKRMIVVGDAAEPFEQSLSEAVRGLVVGDPTATETNLGPMARADLRDELDQQVHASLSQGARLVEGGRPLDGRGFFYAPTLLSDVRPDMTAGCEELFGPVAAIMRAPDAETALEIANGTRFGLSSSIWTADLDKARRMARRIEAGGVFINQISASDPRLPMGGVKLSGYGRELGEAGFREFVNVQTVRVGLG
jgi:succinate-semialdehyde dehydrogenase